jgi:hypothetical protein
VVQVKNGKFVRVEPVARRSVRCTDGIYNSKTTQRENGVPK